MLPTRVISLLLMKRNLNNRHSVLSTLSANHIISRIELHTCAVWHQHRRGPCMTLTPELFETPEVHSRTAAYPPDQKGVYKFGG